MGKTNNFWTVEFDNEIFNSIEFANWTVPQNFIYEPFNPKGYKLSFNGTFTFDIVEKYPKEASKWKEVIERWTQNIVMEQPLYILQMNHTLYVGTVSQDMYAITFHVKKRFVILGNRWGC